MKIRYLLTAKTLRLLLEKKTVKLSLDNKNLRLLDFRPVGTNLGRGIGSMQVGFNFIVR
jgi:hypothetical protein